MMRMLDIILAMSCLRLNYSSSTLGSGTRMSFPLTDIGLGNNIAITLADTFTGDCAGSGFAGGDNRRVAEAGGICLCL